MEPQIKDQLPESNEKSPLHQVTPLSKYLAMVLFIIMPFIGGWIGYTYAPEKVVEVERVVVREVEIEKGTALEEEIHTQLPSNIFNYSSLQVGEKYGGMIAEKVLSSKEDNIKAKFTGNIVLVGTLSAPTNNPEDGGMGPDFSISNLSEDSITKLPRADNDSRTVWFGIDNPSMVDEAGLINRDIVEVTIDTYNYIFLGAGVWNTANIVNIKKVE